MNNQLQCEHMKYLWCMFGQRIIKPLRTENAYNHNISQWLDRLTYACTVFQWGQKIQVLSLYAVLSTPKKTASNLRSPPPHIF